MIRTALLLSLLAPLLPAAAIPELLDLRATREPLREVLSSLAKQCDAGLLVMHAVEPRLGDEVTLTARRATWADASRWLADEFRLTMRLVDGRLEIGDADREFRERLVNTIYDVRTLTRGISTFPGPGLALPEAGGVAARLMPPIGPDRSTALEEIITLLQRGVARETWGISGVAVEDFQGLLAVTQAPEVHQHIRDFLLVLERTAARQVIVRCHRLPADPGQGPVLDAATWNTLAKTLPAPLGVVQLLDEQRSHHFSGI